MANDLLGTLGEAFVLLRADGSTLNADLKKQKKDLEKELSSWESSFKSVGKGLSVSVTAPLVALGTAATAAGLVMDEALDNIRIKTGATGDAAKGLENSFKTVFASVPSSAEDVSNAMSLIYTRTGLTGKALEDLTGTTLDLARLTKSDLNETLKESQDLFSNWGVAAKDQAGNLDYLFNAAQKGGISVTQLMSSLTSSGAVLRGFGFNLQESAALLSAMAKSGIDADTMLNGLRKAAASFAKDGVDLKTGLAGTIEKMKELGPGLAATTIALDVFGNKVGTQVADAVAKGQFNVKQFTDELAKSPDTIKKAADATDGFQEKLILFKNQLTLALEPLGTKFLDIGLKAAPMLESLAGYAGKAADAFSAMSPTAQTVAVAIGAIAAAAGPVTILLGSLIGNVTTVISFMTKWGPVIASTTTLVTALGVAIAGLAIYKIVEAASLLNDLDNQRTQASKDLAAQLTQDQKAIQLALDKTGITAVSAGQAYKILDAYSAGLRGSTMDLTFASNEVRTAFEKGTAAGKDHAIALDEQRKSQDAAGKAALAEAERQKAAAEAKAKAAEKAKALREELEKLTAQYSGDTIAQDAANLVTVLQNIGGVSKLTKEEAGSMFNTFDAALSKLIAEGKEVPPNLRQIYNELFRVAKLPELQQKSLDIWTKSWEDNLKKQEDSLEKDIAKKNDLFIKGMEGASQFIGQAERLTMTEQEKMLADAAKFRDDALKQIEPIRTSMPDIWAAARDSINEIYGKMVKDAGDAGVKSAVAYGKKLGTAIVGAVQAGGGGKAIGASIGGTIGNDVGGKIGESVGGMVAKKLASTLGQKAGSAIGGALGSVVPVLGTMLGAAVGGWIGGLFGGGKEKKEVQAARDELIKNAGGIDALKAKADAAGVSLDKMLSATKMKDFNAEVEKLNKALDMQAKKIEGIGIATSGVNTLAQGLAARLGKVYEDAYAAAKKASKDGNEEITNFTVQGTEDQQAAWQRLAQFTAATFAAQVQQTGDVIGALNSMGDAFATLTDLQAKFGFTADDSTTKLLGLYNTVKDNADVFTSISGVTQIMQGLGEALLVNGDIAASFGQELAADFKTLTDRGVDATTALALMQKPLQQLWQLQKEGKVTVDETTQAMLDQAEAQGIVGEQMKDVNEKILDVLLAIGNALGATIPESVGKFAKAVGGIKVPPIDVPYRYTREGDPLPNSEPTDPNLPGLVEGGMANWGAGTLAVLHGPEAVIPLDRLNEMMGSQQATMDPRALADALAQAGVGGGDITLAPVFNGTLANEMRSFLRETFLPQVISVLQDSGDIRGRMTAVLVPPSTGA